MTTGTIYREVRETEGLRNRYSTVHVNCDRNRALVDGTQKVSNVCMYGT